MKRALIIHAWESNPEEHWYRQEEELLTELGFEVFVPEMPGGTWPKVDEWVDLIKSFNSDENTVLIGHSLGTPAILCYLEAAEKPVGKVFLIAGFAKDLGMEQTKNFVDKSFDWDKIKKNAERFYVLNEKNDPYVPIELGEKMANSLGAEYIPVDGNIHFDTMDLNLINTRIR